MHRINVLSSAIFSEVLKSSFTISDYSVIVGGDFNVIFDQELDGSGGLKKTKDSVKVLEDICLEHDLLDIWRVRHPKKKRFTWRQKNSNNSETLRLLVDKRRFAR